MFISFKIIKFDYKNDTIKFNILRYYNFVEIPIRTSFKSLHCTSINNTIICGIIFYLFDERTYTLSSVIISNITNSKYKELFEFKFQLYEEKFLKLIALNEEKILFFFSNDNRQIICILSKIINRTT